MADIIDTLYLQPKLIELVDREVYYSSSGAEIINTFYIEPLSAAETVMAAFLGGYNYKKKERIPPIIDLRLRDCFCYQVAIIPLDKKQFSYCKSLSDTSLLLNNQQLNANTLKTILMGSYSPDLTRDASDKIMSNYNREAHTAGCFIVAKYKTLISLKKIFTQFVVEEFPLPQGGVQKVSITKAITPGDINLEAFDYVDFKKEFKEIVHPIPFGLRVKTHLPRGVAFDNTGVAPVVREKYQHITIKRLFVPLLGNADLEFMNAMMNTVNDTEFKFREDGHGYKAECLKFVGYEEERMNVPLINDGLNFENTKYANYTLHFDYRTMVQGAVHGNDGKLVDEENGKGIARVTWNHMLVFPGYTAAAMAKVKEFGDKVGNVLFGLDQTSEPISLGWYRVGWDQVGAFPLGGAGIDKLAPPYYPRPADYFTRLFKLGFE